MKKLTYVLCIILAVILVFSCQNPFVGTSSGGDGTSEGVNSGVTDETTGETGVVSFSIQRISPYLLEEFRVASSSEATGRAYMFAHQAHYEVLDSNGNLVIDPWDMTVTSTEQGITTTQAIPKGTGYTVIVEIFNIEVSSVTPVVIGETTFDVLYDTGNDAVVDLFPYSSIQLEAGVDETVTLLSSDVVQGNPPEVVDTGEEQWYKIVPDDQNNTAINVTVTPDSESNTYFSVYSDKNEYMTGAINPAWEAGSSGDAASASFGIGSAGSYYIGVIGERDGVNDSTLTVNFTYDNNIDDSYEHNDDFFSSYDLTSGSPLSGVDVISRDLQLYDPDYFSFGIGADTIVTITATFTEASSPKGTIYLYDADENEIASADETDNFSLATSVLSGSVYYIGIDSVYEATSTGMAAAGAYSLTISTDDTVSNGRLTAGVNSVPGNFEGSDFSFSVFPEGADPGLNDPLAVGEFVIQNGGGSALAYEYDAVNGYPTGNEWYGTGGVSYDVYGLIDADGDQQISVGDCFSDIYLTVPINGDQNYAFLFPSNFIRVFGGELYLPVGTNLDGTDVYFCWDDNDNPDDGWVSDEIFTFGTNDWLSYNAWVFIDTYYIYAFADVDGNGSYDDGTDYFGYANFDPGTETPYSIYAGDSDPWWDIDLDITHTVIQAE